MLRNFILCSLVASIFMIDISGTTMYAGNAKNSDFCIYVNDANMRDYSYAISESGQRASYEEINNNLKEYGKYINTPGMPTEEFVEALNNEWIDTTFYTKVPRTISISLTERYTYEALCKIMRRMSTHKGVYLIDIGASTSGKRMFALVVDMSMGSHSISTATNTVLLTGQVHARETAGPAYILKELIDAITEYENGVESYVNMMNRTRFVAVPCVNPDGHDGVGFDKSNWTYSDGILWKATSNGTDLNRNFPGLNWMLLKNGIKQTEYRATSPDKLYYWGDYAGSCSETKAMIKFYQYWIGCRKAAMLIDYHQQGRITYTGKGYAPSRNNELCESLRKACYSLQGDIHYGYDYGDTAEDYGVNGTGSTNTDYAWAVALGAKFSERYGFSVFADGDNEYTLLEVQDADSRHFNMKVENFRTLSWEIGYGQDYLGYSNSTLKLLEKEYYKYAFDKMLFVYDAELQKD